MAETKSSATGREGSAADTYDDSTRIWHSPGHLARYRERVAAEQARLRAVAADCDAAQQRTLTELVEANAQTLFGRQHGFASIRSVRDLRAAVPIRDYAGHAPWIEQAAAGRTAVLTADAPRVFFTSSGSTGARKKVPVTARFMHRSFFPFYLAAWAPLAEHYPQVLERPDAALNLKHDPLAAPDTTASGRPYAGASQIDLGRMFGEPLSAEPGSSAPWATLPVPAARDDHERKMYLRLRMAVESDVRLVIGINPAMIAALPYQLRVWWPRIVKDVHDGTFDGAAGGEPNPGRAAELERLEARHGTVLPAHVWPRISALFCWTTGAASLYLPRLREEYGIGVAVLPAPIAASEGPIAVPLDRHATAGSLIADAAVYEFIDADEPIEPDSATLAAYELEPGRDYHVVFSHVGGFYRYSGGDVVRVVDRVGGAPRLDYAGRATVSDAAGERLRDAHAVRALMAACSSTGLGLRSAACRVEKDPVSDLPYYEFAAAGRQTWSPAEITAFATALDSALGAQSSGYRAARTAGRLGAAVVQTTDHDAFQRDWLATVAAGTRPTQVKDRIFRQRPEDWRRLAPGAAARPEGGLVP
ncbi:GH3 family domain-containing protein [Actinocrinis sp.]|uniref:GH3 family domain-containing protein n=1 Tax=Actinocrinis sp. TaxID=1920516 RepID=UPI002CE322FC|nr:GH3 auxin-responsive promoter family protein [Actinocrinis sp.]HXR72565.1 GH3 auxin-responsive promoter family protein [Actinocrinis sp.]